MHTLKHPSDTTATTTTETTPARALVAREDIARAILATMGDARWQRAAWMDGDACARPGDEGEKHAEDLAA